MNRKFAAAAGLGVAATLSLAACSGAGTATEPSDSDEPVTLTVSGWALDAIPEFQLLADAFEDENPNVTVELKEYDAAEYNTLMTADLAAGSAPDIIAQKEVKQLTTWQEGGQLLDVSDVELPDGIAGAESYQVDGVAYAVPYRKDSWVVYYNVDLFELAGVDLPDGSWTWDEYAETANELTEGLAAAGSDARGTYTHRWQSAVQGFATAQADADILSGDYGYLADFYDTALALQEDGDTVDFNTSTANQLTYQGEFGTQQTAMMPMGTWYVATLVAQQKSGEAETFEWGIAPAPQVDDSTTGLDNEPITFGDPTGFGVNAAIDPAKEQAATDFLEFVASEEAAKLLASIGVTPALINDDVVEAYFAVEGVPADDLSQFAWSVHDTRGESPTSTKTAAVQGILGELHTAVMSGSTSVDDAISAAEERVKNEVGVD